SIFSRSLSAPAIYTLSLHDALPIFWGLRFQIWARFFQCMNRCGGRRYEFPSSTDRRLRFRQPLPDLPAKFLGNVSELQTRNFSIFLCPLQLAGAFEPPRLVDCKSEVNLFVRP